MLKGIILGVVVVVALVVGSASGFVAEVEAEACEQGYYTCPDDGEQFWYANSEPCVWECGAIGTKPTAFNACNNYCSAACYASAWFAC